MNRNQINKELKVFINEASFISNKCRNKLLKLFSEEFHVSLDIDNYKNVDLSILEDFKILYREDTYEADPIIKDLEDLNERYQRFEEKAKKLINRKEIDFQNKSNFKNISNLIILFCMFFVMFAAVVLGIQALFSGHFRDCIWFLVFVLPWIFPKFSSSLQVRLEQARQYIKRLLKKVK